ncbi:MAG: Ig-like domain-containing protein [Bacteroides sp.]|nr:Ig-like domain-containing protein [Ruminococcus flavefaciens]MCM1555288.1 Ig-like domain-containing protein [Bacteroides sp.]
MKKVLLSLGMTLALCFTGKVTAQHAFVSASETSESNLEYRLMDAFQGANVNAIPFESQSGLAEYTDLAKKMDVSVKLRPLSENRALQNAFKAGKRKAGTEAKASVAELNVDTVIKQPYWGLISAAEDGRQLIFVVEYREHPNSSFYVNGATYTFFDDDMKQLCSFSLETPEFTQSISLMSNYSTRFFNSDAKKEFMVAVHSFATQGGGPEACRDTLFIINESGETIGKFGHTGGGLLHSFERNGSTQYRVQLNDAFYSDLDSIMYSYIYDAKKLLSAKPDTLYTFAIPEDLTTYSNGALAAFTQIDGEPYYITTQYQKPFVKDGVHNDTVIDVEKDNLFEIFIYDMDFELVKKIQLPLLGMEKNDLSMSTLMYFGKYMITRHTFNSDDKFELIYGMDRYDISCDCGKIQFYLMDEDGNTLREIADEVALVTELQGLIGQEDEFALCLGSEDAVEAIVMLNLPSFNSNFTFPAIHENELLSMNFERVPDVNGGYNYVFGLGRGETVNNTVMGNIVYYNLQGKAVKRVRIDLGYDVQYFQPIINSLTMNPYVFVPDEQQEYLYFYRFTKGSAAGRGFGIANENETLYKWQDNDTDGSFSSAGVLTDATSTVLKNLYISWESETEAKTVFYTLPLRNIELQGKGTKAEPYIITTPAELDLVRNYPEAWFILGNDIDMAAFTGVNQQGFTSIPKFSGHFDGRNHFIKNIVINGYGLFKELSGATVSNLFIRNAVFSNAKSNAGVIAGNDSNRSRITNCHVESDLNISADKVGGLVGQAVNYASIDRCSFTGNISGNSENVGGIAGYITTGVTVANCLVKGSVSGAMTVGGLVGLTYSGATVNNSYADASVYASAYQAGGLVGENNGQVTRTYAAGKVEVDSFPQNKWNKGKAGGLAGETITGMFNGQVKYSVALNDTVIAPEHAYRVAYAEGYRDANELKYMDSVYALASMKVGSRKNSATVSDDNCAKDRANGESGTRETFNKAFYESLGWQFGNDSAHPWQMTGDMPRLWFEFSVRGVEISSKAASVAKGSTITLAANVIPQEATNKTVIWNSTSPLVAMVDQQGVVKGMNAGTATITATTADGGFVASCEVTVVIPVEQVVLAEKEIFLTLGTTTAIKYSVLPEDATNKNVLFLSLNPAIALTGGPAVYGVEEGTTQIVAVSEDGAASDTCTVYVQVPITGIVLNKSEITLDKKTPSFQLTAIIYPEEAANTPVVWKTANASIAMVTDKGLVTAGSKGQTVITANSQDGRISAPCVVTVTENVSNQGDVQNMVLAYMQNNNIVVTASCGMEWVKVYNLSGQCVASRHAKGAETLTVPAADMPQGVYLLQIGLAGNKTVNTKVIR